MSDQTKKPAGPPAILEKFGAVVGLDPQRAQNVLMATIMPSGSTPEQIAVFLAVCGQHGLNPLTKQIAAFSGQRGQVVPVVMIDGWLQMANRHPQFDGLDHEDRMDDAGNLVAITCRVYRKDRGHPISATEYMAECKKPGPVWNQWPARMLRHKATIQAIRMAFSFSGIYDEDEAERIVEARSAADKRPDDLASFRDASAAQLPGGTIVDAKGAIEATKKRAPEPEPEPEDTDVPVEVLAGGAEDDARDNADSFFDDERGMGDPEGA